jgi:hypothetical protein
MKCALVEHGCIRRRCAADNPCRQARTFTKGPRLRRDTQVIDSWLRMALAPVFLLLDMGQRRRDSLKGRYQAYMKNLN